MLCHRKILLEAYASINALPPVWMPKKLIFQANCQKIEPLINTHPRIVKKIKFVISREFLVIRLHQKPLQGTLFFTLLSFRPELPTVASKL